MSKLPAEDIAKICHEVNRTFSRGLGDRSHEPWEDAPEWQKESAIEGVKAHLRGEVDGPEESHNLWLSHKESEGWVYGAVKDPESKTHPCMVPYEELPLDQRQKDKLFAAVVEACK